MKIITTVGTSILKNWADNTGCKYPKDEMFSEQAWKEVIDDGRVEIVCGWANGKQNASAEIASIIKIQEELKKKGINQIEVHLICTETILSRLAAECIQKWFEKCDSITFPNAPIVVKDLRVETKIIFEKGLLNLFNEIDEKIVEKDTSGKRKWNEIILNITGGYKAIIPHLTILGQIYQRPIYYVFDEGTDNNYELMKIPILPISFDWLVSEIYGQMLSSDFALQNFSDDNAFGKLKNYGLAKGNIENKQVDVFGSLLWQHINSERPESPSVMGLFVEMKMYEYFNENRSLEYNDMPQHGVILWWNGKDETQKDNYKLVQEKGFNTKKVEIDLILKNIETGSYAFVEVKSVKQIGSLVEPNGKGRIDLLNKIKALNTYYGIPNEFILIIHKNDKIPINMNEQRDYFNKIKEICSTNGIKTISIHTIDFKVGKDEESLNFSEFLNQPINKTVFDNNKIEI